MRDMWEHMPDGMKMALDALSITALLGAMTEMLPHVAAILTIIWTVLRIFETETVQRMIGKREAENVKD
jgi:hypothetical protein